MDIKAFKNKKNRRVVNGKSGNKNIRIQIINYDDTLYSKWSNVIEVVYGGEREDIELTDLQINEMFNDFTNVKFTLEELNELLDDPNHIFSTIFTELQIVLNEMIERYLQQKQLEIIKTKRILEETKVMIEYEKFQETIDKLSATSVKAQV